ncbi:hypothetical protein MTR67_036722 [Solanum verrucosum]|uniref:Plastid lipid-associated protein/fibrillin conserved domain-containing protein n=1 Tax=Solanum verrucosum TaxID=315347 RepID=A0AAF0ZLE3_SOLVR|nr:hypothetical protein MTR67_036722 [Solanum verrucosum]
MTCVPPDNKNYTNFVKQNLIQNKVKRAKSISTIYIADGLKSPSTTTASAAISTVSPPQDVHFQKQLNMSTLYNPLIFTIKNPKITHKPHTSLPSSVPTSRLRKFPNFSVQSSISSSNDPEKPTFITPDNDKADDKTVEFVDEWGEKSEPEPGPVTKLADSDPPKYEDEWGNGSPGVDGSVGEDEKLLELKRCLVDTVYGTDFGFRASSEIRAEALEFVSQLEAANPTPAPTESPELLDGNWILVIRYELKIVDIYYLGSHITEENLNAEDMPFKAIFIVDVLFTAFSELLPLLAVGNIPLLKVEKICQDVNTNSLTIENATTLSSPVATLSFSATATFEVRSPSRIQVEFKEGNFKPPEIKSNIDLPETVDLFGQKISLSPVQQSLGPLENAVAGIARTISGQPPLKIPIPGERTKSWLLTTYLDKDMRISRGDGGLFVLVKEGSSLLY